MAENRVARQRRCYEGIAASTKNEQSQILFFCKHEILGYKFTNHKIQMTFPWTIKFCSFSGAFNRRIKSQYLFICTHLKIKNLNFKQSQSEFGLIENLFKFDKIKSKKVRENFSLYTHLFAA